MKRDRWRRPAWGAKELGVGLSAVHRWIQAGRLQAIKTPGGGYRFKESWFWQAMRQAGPIKGGRVPARTDPAHEAAMEEARRMGCA